MTNRRHESYYTAEAVKMTGCNNLYKRNKAMMFTKSTNDELFIKDISINIYEVYISDNE